MTEPASLTAMRQLVAKARLRRSLGPRRVPVRPGRSGPAGAPDQEAAYPRQDDAEHELADADADLVAGEPRHRRDQQDEGHAENEQPDQALTTGAAGAGGTGIGG
jgi:hypothetical protein